jgi:glycosyltransferase involved in cell wall biosynthesis
MSKIKIFLGGFVNYTNAQNLNCLGLAQHLDKEKFDVYTLELHSGNLDSQVGKIPGVTIFNCFKPFRISGYLGFLWGIWKCDVAYLPKHELWKFNRFLLQLFNKKSFSTVEGIFDEKTYNNSIQALGSEKSFFESKNYFTKLYSITGYMNQYNAEKYNIITEPQTLYLGVENTFIPIANKGNKFSCVLMVGNDLVRKGALDYLDIAAEFKHIEFVLAGSGNGKIDLNKEIKERNLKNVRYLGMITVNQLKEVLNTVQLHILPSRSEGFPKVILETAAAGVPSIVYSDYGAKEWITSRENGWVVETKEEIVLLIHSIEQNFNHLNKVSANAVQLANQFDWSSKIKDWEEVVQSLINK